MTLIECAKEKKRLEKLLEKECPKQNENCHTCPFEIECDRYSRLFHEMNE